MQVGAKAQAPDFLPETTAASAGPVATNAPVSQPVAVADLHIKLEEAKALLKSRASSVAASNVTLAVLDRESSAIELVTVAKDSFLTKGMNLAVTSQNGHALYLSILRANGVNTAVRVTDATGKELTPLTVAFPIVKGGALIEVAYYSSVHPAIESNEITTAGETYISAMLDEAARALAAKGIHVSADIVEIAENLCVVEHTDHRRFMTEDHTKLLPEVVSLYALNRGNTFRYSVSTAGAGGMIQMIPRTYEAIRQAHQTVPLQADFVAGMRDHANALQAMLLYLNDTWANLEGSSEVKDALRNGVATKPELLAAGYNSNPVKLPMYIANGGTSWRTLIPAETQMYLAIYSEVDRNIAFRSREETDAVARADEANVAASARGARIEALLAWVNGLYARVL
jgi:hypothetical protein